MYRITATLKTGHDMESIVFMIRETNLARALMHGIKAMQQLGFEADDYDLAHSQRL